LPLERRAKRNASEHDVANGVSDTDANALIKTFNSRFKGILREKIPTSSGIYAHPCGLNVRSLVAGYRRRASTGRTGLRTNSPPQFGHLPFRRVSTHVEQNVHSNEQIMAASELGGRSQLQHSQFGFMSSMAVQRRLCSDPRF
jgi:hypothetical protein